MLKQNTKNNNTAALIGINLYSVLFVYLFIQFLECSFLLNMSIAPENKARFVLFVMCIFILIFNKDTTMTTIFIFAHFGLNILHSFVVWLPWKDLSL